MVWRNTIEPRSRRRTTPIILVLYALPRAPNYTKSVDRKCNAPPYVKCRFFLLKLRGKLERLGPDIRL